jgi:hypothetical protein
MSTVVSHRPRPPRAVVPVALASLAGAIAACPLLPNATVGSGGSAASSSSSTSASTTTSASSSTTASSSGTSQSSASSSSSSSSGAGGAPSNACLDASDAAVLHALTLSSFANSVEACAATNANIFPPGVKEPACRDCIDAATKGDGGPGLSGPCLTCFDAYANCAVAQCGLQCDPPSSSTCSPCLDQSCTPAFTTCSGLTAP